MDATFKCSFISNLHFSFGRWNAENFLAVVLAVMMIMMMIMIDDNDDARNNYINFCVFNE